MRMLETERRGVLADAIAVRDRWQDRIDVLRSWSNRRGCSWGEVEVWDALSSMIRLVQDLESKEVA